MPRPTYRVHFVTHHDGRMTGRLLPARGAVRQEPTGYGETHEQIFSQIALALEEMGDRSAYLWTDALTMRKVKVSVHPQTIINNRHVIAKDTLQLEIGYACARLARDPSAKDAQTGYRVLVPRFGWWFVLEQLEMAAEVIANAVANEMLGSANRSLYNFRSVAAESIEEWAPTLSKIETRLTSASRDNGFPTLNEVAEEWVAFSAGSRNKRRIVGEFDFSEVLTWVENATMPSLLLVGPPGAGKTTWVRALARQIANRRKEGLETRIWSTSADRILSGMVYLGMWEKRCLDIVAELEGEGDFLFVDRLTPLLNRRSGHSSILEMFAPAMAAGEVSLIAECTADEFERLSSEAPGILNLFRRVDIEAPDTGSMIPFLREYQARINRRLTIGPTGLRRLVDHLEFFARDTSFPGKGVRFLDWLNQSGFVAPGEAQESVILNAAGISAAFARRSGLPIELISEDHVAGPEAVSGRLRQGVIGQDEACTVAARVLTRFKAGLNDPERPLGSLFFVGPTGVGKTELAKQLARYMFSDAKRMVRLDMSEFMLPGSSQRLLAVGRGVKSLVEAIRQQPLSLILLDEVEKAHPEVFDLLLAMLGEGRMTDQEGRLVDFRMSLVVMTSNLGVRKDASLGFGEGGDPARELERAVRQHFRPEFFNRIDYVIPFRALTPPDIRAIVDLELGKLSQREGLTRRGIELRVSDAARDWLAERGYDPKRGARPLKRVIEEHIVGPLAVELAADPKLRDRIVRVERDDEGVAVLV